jgi:hypothetical protein
VADLLRRYDAVYRAERESSLSNAQRRAMRAITVCRTAALAVTSKPATTVGIDARAITTAATTATV